MLLHRFGSSKECRNRRRGDQVVATRMTDLGQSIVLRANDNETAACANLSLEAGIETIRVFLHIEAARRKVRRDSLVGEVFLVCSLWIRVKLLVDAVKLVMRCIDGSSDCVTKFLHLHVAVLVG